MGDPIEQAMIDGSDQAHRRVPALAPDYFHVDELGFAQRVAISAELAARLAFVDAEQAEKAEQAGAGHWQALLRGDELLLLALLAADSAGLNPPTPGGADNDEATLRMARELLRQALQLDRWLRDLRAVDARQALESTERAGGSAARRVAATIEKHIADPLAHQLAGVLDQFGLRHAWERLLPLWRRSLSAPAPSAAARNERDLRNCWQAFAAARRQVQALAHELMLRELAAAPEAGGRHEPAATLLATFLQLYGRVQERINRFTDRHTDFYYLDCLGLTPRAGVADRLHLAVARDARIAQQVRLAADTVFLAGRDAQGRPIEFRAEKALEITDACVAALCSVTVERDPLMSPERELAHVTRVLARRIELPATAATPAAAEAADAPWWPAFGGDAPDADMGIALASPMLWLAEGEREIRLSFGVARPAQGDAAAVAQRLQALERADTCAAFFNAFGDLFCHWLLAEDETLLPPERQRIHAAAQRWVPELQQASIDSASPLALLAGQPVERELVFHQLFEGAFAVSLSTPEGWLLLDEAHLTRAAQGSGDALLLTLPLRTQDPPITACDPAVHGARWQHGLPMLRLQLKHDSRQFPYTLLTSLELRTLRIDVAVRGLRDVTLANQLGPLDPARPFQPFGPLPELGAHLVIGAREMACKPVQALDIQLQWNGLPTGPGGFEAHYADYHAEGKAKAEVNGRRRFTNDGFTVEPAVLCGGQWMRPEGDAHDARLFATQPGSRRLLPAQRVPLASTSLQPLFQPEPRPAPGADFHYDLRSRNGFVRLRLSAPEGAFGHHEHPLVLTRVITANARRRHVRPLPLPRPPYTPLLERITLDYRAGCAIAIGAPASEHHLYHLHPFGSERIDPPEAIRHTLLPRYPEGGHLLIGLQASEPGGLLTLLFHLREEAAIDRPTPRAALQWSWLRNDEWLPLPPECLLSDGTEGLLRSGVVEIDMPRAMSSHNAVMPAGLYWLCVSAPGDFKRHAGLYGVMAQALTLTRCPGEAGDVEAAAELPPCGVSGPAASIAGLASVRQVGPSFGLRRREDPAQLRVRAGERLRHRQRASTAWDIERLVLEAFPAVFKAKAFAHLRSHAPGEHPPPSPGHVLVALVPAAQPGGALQRPRLNAAQLQRINDHLAQHASPFARFEVRNAAYEPVQVRCRLRLARGTQSGRCLQRLEQALVNFLSPWGEGGRPAVFGWRLSCEDVQSFIRAQPEVDAVTGVSLLQVAEGDDGSAWLADTALPRAGEAPAAASQLSGRVPWSIAVPMERHLLELHDDLRRARPEPSGVSHLGIGSTFIVGGA